MKKITDPSFRWIPSSSHDADSRPFYERQMQRIREANEARALIEPKVTQLKDRKARDKQAEARETALRG